MTITTPANEKGTSTVVQDVSVNLQGMVSCGGGSPELWTLAGEMGVYGKTISTSARVGDVYGQYKHCILKEITRAQIHANESPSGPWGLWATWTAGQANSSPDPGDGDPGDGDPGDGDPGDGDQGIGTDETAGGNPSENNAGTCAGDPICVVTGDFFQSETDVSLPGRGFPLTASRTYSAHNAGRVGRFGYGWADPFGTRLVVPAPFDESKFEECHFSGLPGTSQDASYLEECNAQRDAEMATAKAEAAKYFVLQETGSTVTFTRGVGDSFTAPARVLADLRTNTDGTFTMVRRGKTFFTFAADGALVAIRDPHGNAVTVERDAAGRVSLARSSSGRSLTFTYAGEFVSSVTDSAGRVVKYVYDTAGDLVSVTDPAGAVTSYTYDENHRMLSQTFPDGKKVTNVYDEHSRVVSQSQTVSATQSRTMTFSYDVDNTTITEADGTKRIVRHSGLKLTSQTFAAGTPAEATYEYAYTPALNLASVTDPLGRVTKTSDDASGNITSRTDAAGRTSSFTYDGDGDLTSVTDPAGAKSAVEYDAAGNPVKVTDALGAVSTFTYNADGTVATSTDAMGRTTSYAYTPTGDLASATDAAGGVTTYAYDAAGRVTSTTSPTGRVTTFTYDAGDRVVKATDPTGAVTSFTYDAAGRLTSTTDPLGRVSKATYNLMGERLTATDPTSATTAFSYDAVGRLASVTDAAGNVAKQAYDPAGRVASITDELGRATTFSYDTAGQQVSATAPSGATSKTTYNADGSIASTSDALGRTTTYAYDTARRVIAVTDPLGRTSRTSYDAVGRVTMATAADGTFQTWTYNAAGQELTYRDQAGKTTTYTYDAAGRRVGANVPGGGLTTYDWTAENELAKVATGVVTTTAAAGTTTTQVGGAAYVYDKAGRLANIDHAGTTPDVSFTYDAAGQRTRMVDGSGTTTYTYDPAGRTTRVAAPTGATAFAYNALGQQTSITYPDLRVATYTYDAAGQMTKVSVPTGAASGTKAPTGTAAVGTFTYTADGQLASLANAKTGAFRSYDTAGFLTGLKVSPVTTSSTGVVSATGTALSTYSYSYDMAAQLTAQTVSGGVDTSRQYGFNARGQLDKLTNTGTAATSATPSGAYTYDAVGNVTATPAGDVLNYDATGRLTVRVPRAGPQVSYTYDLVGNRTAATTAATSTTQASISTYAYDAADRLASATVPTAKLGYTYDGDGLRVARARTATGSTTTTSERFAWNTTGALPVMLADGATDYIYGPGATPIAQIDRKGGAVTWLHTDLTGSVTTLTSATGTVTGRAAYGPYGARETSTGTLSRFGYAGEYTDVDTGLVYLRARDYDPATAQFLTRDPIENLTGEAYGYASGNPLQYGDPTGLASTRAGWFSWSDLGNDILTSASTAATGFGDGATDDWTKSVRETMDPGTSCFVDSGAWNYKLTWWLGAVGGEIVRTRHIKEALPRPELVGCLLRRDSFTADTLVVMGDGRRKPIAEIKVGDQVLATDPETGRTAVREVTAVHINNDAEFTDLTVTEPDGDQSVINTTQHHPFWNATTEEWEDAVDLGVGEQLLTDTGQRATVTASRSFIGANVMYNLTVADIHTFYVFAGDTPILVHNTNCGGWGGLRGDAYDPAVIAQRSAEWAARIANINGRAAQRAVDRGQAPRQIGRIDEPEESVPGSQWHAQGPGRGSPGINMDGSFHDGNPHWPGKVIGWLRDYGWQV
ncbi:polymorphic toxin-type HINT domain-containing protein [Kineococcus sp. NUM-3379]